MGGRGEQAEEETMRERRRRGRWTHTHLQKGFSEVSSHVRVWPARLI